MVCVAGEWEVVLVEVDTAVRELPEGSPLLDLCNPSR